MMIRCTNGNLINPQKMELFTIIEENNSFFVSAITGNSRYDLIYTNNRPEADAILDALFEALKPGFARNDSIDYIEYIKERKYNNYQFRNNGR